MWGRPRVAIQRLDIFKFHSWSLISVVGYVMKSILTPEPQIGVWSGPVRVRTTVRNQTCPNTRVTVVMNPGGVGTEVPWKSAFIVAPF